jgi:putative tryptophan/tyrosine transport system substrate-binding protein
VKRREFITLLGGAAVVWPFAARAQQAAMSVVGFLGPALVTRQHWLTAFRRGLGREGFIEGQNVTIEYRSADSGTEGLPELAAELIRRQVAVIFASGPPAALAAKRATQTIPIVFVSGGDPVQMGLVSSFHRPDGNVTGFYFLATELVAKRLALLHELFPRAERVAVHQPMRQQPSLRRGTWPSRAARSVLISKSSTSARARRSTRPSRLS